MLEHVFMYCWGNHTDTCFLVGCCWTSKGICAWNTSAFRHLRWKLTSIWPSAGLWRQSVQVPICSGIIVPGQQTENFFQSRCFSVTNHFSKCETLLYSPDSSWTSKKWSTRLVKPAGHCDYRGTGLWISPASRRSFFFEHEFFCRICYGWNGTFTVNLR